MKLYDDYGHEVTDPKMLKALKALEGIIADIDETPKHEPDYSDIEIYDDYGRRVTNRDTLEAIAESEEIIAAWRKRNGVVHSA